MYITKKSYAIFFPNSVSWRGLQPRIAPVCTGAGAGSSSTRFRRRFRRFPRRSGIWCRDRSGSTGSTVFRRRFRRRSGEAPGQVQQGSGEGSGEGFGEGSRKPWCKAKSGSTGPGEGCREGPGEGFGNLWCRARSGSNRFKGFPALGFAARFRKICINKTLRLLGIPPKLILSCC